MAVTGGDGEDCPFCYPPGEEPEPVVHAPIGVCEHCGGEAFTKCNGFVLCWVCAYSEASWTT